MQIKMLVMDVDGTLTDGKIYIGNEGELFKAFSVKDGLQIKKLKSAGIEPVIITGRKSKIVEQRCNELGISELYQGVSDKLSCLKNIAAKREINPSEIAYVGDDENDIECIQYCGHSACPSDANPMVVGKVDKVCDAVGGNGCVAEFIISILQSSYA